MYKLECIRRRGGDWTTPTCITAEHPELRTMLEIARHMADAWYATRVTGPDGAVYLLMSRGVIPTQANAPAAVPPQT